MDFVALGLSLFWLVVLVIYTLEFHGLNATSIMDSVVLRSAGLSYFYSTQRKVNLSWEVISNVQKSSKKTNKQKKTNTHHHQGLSVHLSRGRVLCHLFVFPLAPASLQRVNCRPLKFSTKSCPGDRQFL